MVKIDSVLKHKVFIFTNRKPRKKCFITTPETLQNNNLLFYVGSKFSILDKRMEIYLGVKFSRKYIKFYYKKSSF